MRDKEFKKITRTNTIKFGMIDKVAKTLKRSKLRQKHLRNLYWKPFNQDASDLHKVVKLLELCTTRNFKNVQIKSRVC